MFKVNNKDTSKEQAIVNFEHVNASWPWTKKKQKKTMTATRSHKQPLGL